MVKLEMYKKIISDYLKSEMQALRAVIIFGSFANNSENKYSDIDIAFLSSKYLQLNDDRKAILEDIRNGVFNE